MRIVCAPDSFKESMTSVEAAEAMDREIHHVDPSIRCELVPMADGGEGTTEALVVALDGESVEAKCHDALNRPTTGWFGFVSRRRLAVIEVAEAAGLAQIDQAERDPWAATSRGVGELALSALDRGATEFIIGLGGSATNDAGLRISVQTRPSASATCSTTPSAVVAEPARTTTNETTCDKAAASSTGLGSHRQPWELRDCGTPMRPCGS